MLRSRRCEVLGRRAELHVAQGPEAWARNKDIRRAAAVLGRSLLAQDLQKDIAKQASKVGAV